jgi:hypothetical protein
LVNHLLIRCADALFNRPSLVRPASCRVAHLPTAQRPARSELWQLGEVLRYAAQGRPPLPLLDLPRLNRRGFSACAHDRNRQWLEPRRGACASSVTNRFAPPTRFSIVGSSRLPVFENFHQCTESVRLKRWHPWLLPAVPAERLWKWDCLGMRANAGRRSPNVMRK